MSSPFDSYSKEEIGNLKEKYYELEKLCLNTRDSKIIDKIIKEHKNCITSDLCINCELVEDYKYSNPGMKYPWMLLAQNKNLKYAQHKILYKLTFEWQGMNDDYIFNILENKNLDSNTRKLIIDHQDFMVGNGNGDSVPNLFEMLLTRPDFTKSELKLFLKDAEAWNYYDDLKQMFDDKFGAEK
jgi:hypothetical protein